MQANNLSANLRNYAMLSDAEVVQRILDGDHPLFELIMRRYNQRLFRCARGILHDDPLAQDAVQEAYLSAFRYLHQFRGPAGLGAWLTRITVRAATRIARKEAAMKLISPSADLDDLCSPEAAGPERATIDAEIVHGFEDTVDRLPRDFRVVFMLRELEGMSLEETASALGVKPATVKTRLHRAKNLLRTRYGTRLNELCSHAFAFAGERCDAIVEQVFHKLQTITADHRG